MDDRPTEPAARRSAEPEPFTPFQFGRYQILEELGRGGMGVVYRAYQADLDRTVAIKMILAHHLYSPGFAERFHAEAKAAAKVHHPNIVSIYETGVHHNQHYIAMQFVPGQSLARLFARRAIDLYDAAGVVADIARAVHFLHQQQVLHRDLKPSNILVAEDGRPFLTDFGLALVRGGVGTGPAGVAGTPGYVAPEVVRNGASGTSETSDIYSLGATLYEAATGRAPFADRPPAQAFVEVLEKDPPPPHCANKSIPVALETIILKCMDRNPGKRYATALELAHDLDQFQIGEPIRATPPAGLARMRRWVRGHTPLATRLIGIGVFGLLTAWNTFGTQLLTHTFLLSVWIWLGVWATASVICEQLEARHESAARIAWAGIDGLVLTMVLQVADGVASPLLLAYPVWIATAGFWYRVSLVVLTTGLALLSYLVLVLDATWHRPHLAVATDRHLVFVTVVVLTGVVIGMQTRRARSIRNHLARRA